MAKIKKFKDSDSTYKYIFICPGCNQEHVFNTTTWTFNQDFDKPTIEPSYLMKGGRPKKGLKHDTELFVCHSFITDGKIKFLEDCTHHLKGQTVDLPDYEESVSNKVL